MGLSALTTGAVVASTQAASPAPATVPAKVSCRQTLLVFLYWPHGHRAIRSVGFTRDPTVHLEAYKYAAGYPRSAFLALARANRQTRFAKACHKKGGSIRGAIRHKKIARKQRAFTCRVPKGSLLTTKQVKGGLVVDAGTASVHVVSARIVKTGSSFSYDARLCRSGASPR
jgi:hypothetical protein